MNIITNSPPIHSILFLFTVNSLARISLFIILSATRTATYHPVTRTTTMWVDDCTWVCPTCSAPPLPPGFNCYASSLFSEKKEIKKGKEKRETARCANVG